MTYSSEGSINRYYDPSTDQFISVDPAVQQTDQPYVFTNDNPLNSNDPLGIYASSGTGESAFAITTKSKSSGVVKTTVTVTSGSKSVKVTVSTSPVTVPLGLGVSATISASATFSESGSQSNPSLNVDTDGSVGITANGATTSVADNGGAVMTSLSGALPGGSGPSLNIGGDQVTTSIDVSLSYDGTPSPSLWDYIQAGLITTASIAWAYAIKPLSETCEDDPDVCAGIVLAPVGM